MIDPEQREALVKNRLEQAYEIMRTAEKLVEFGDYRSVLNRTYYAMFYALSALALHEDFQTSNHGQLLGWFNKTFVKGGVFEPQLSRILRDAFDRRMDADYEFDPLPDISDIPPMLADMKRFISTIKDYLEEQLRQG
jgi:uncharacterized protein (UPF0332 family)